MAGLQAWLASWLAGQRVKGVCVKAAGPTRRLDARFLQAWQLDASMLEASRVLTGSYGPFCKPYPFFLSIYYTGDLRAYRSVIGPPLFVQTKRYFFIKIGFPCGRFGTFLFLRLLVPFDPVSFCAPAAVIVRVGRNRGSTELSMNPTGPHMGPMGVQQGAICAKEGPTWALSDPL